MRNYEKHWRENMKKLTCSSYQNVESSSEYNALVKRKANAVVKVCSSLLNQIIFFRVLNGVGQPIFARKTVRSFATFVRSNSRNMKN